jgi:hypothetical protein
VSSLLVLIFVPVFWLRSHWVIDDLSFASVTASDDDFADHRIGIRTGPQFLELYSSRAIYLADSLFLVKGLERDLAWGFHISHGEVRDFEEETCGVRFPSTFGFASGDRELSDSGSRRTGYRELNGNGYPIRAGRAWVQVPWWFLMTLAALVPGVRLWRASRRQPSRQ